MRSTIQNAAMCGCLLASAQCYAVAQEPGDSGAANSPTSGTAAVGSQFTFTPMTGSERVKNYFKGLVDPLAFVRSAAGAGIDQAENYPKEWGQGSQCYGRRFASSFGEHIVDRTIVFGLSSALHEDNRYFRSGESGFGARTKYAVGSTFLARRNDGTRRISISRLVGFTGAALISRLWQPRSTRNLRDAGISLGTEVGVSAGFNVVREFLFYKP